MANGLVHLVFRSLLFYRRPQFAVALGVAAATAVLTGALLVGDSVRGSLRALTLDRLGAIDEMLVVDRFFRADLASEWQKSKAFEDNYRAIAPAILFPSVTLETSGEHPRRAANVLAVGSDEAFWKLGSRQIQPKKLPQGDEIVLNQPLADALGVKIGDELVLRLPQANEVPADSALGSKDNRVETASGLKVIDIIPAESLGRFALRPSQSLPRNAYLSLEKLQAVLEQEDHVNALLIAGKDADQPPSKQASAALADALEPTLDDYGVRVEDVELKGPSGKTIYHYQHITTDRMIFSPALSEAVQEAAPAFPVFTYLANTIALADKKDGVPYSTVTALDPRVTHPVVDSNGMPVELKDDEIALNSWTAENLGAKVGDQIRLDYFAPETTHGEAVETSATFTLRSITPLTEPTAGFRKRGRKQEPATYDMDPTAANDWHLTPVVKGITDQASIDDWDPPFPFDQKRVRTEDDTYWENHRTTPKAFLSYEAGKKLWGSRFGNATSYLVKADVPQLREKLLVSLHKHRADLGFAPLRIKAQGLQASAGSTPFDVLFLFLSFFIIAAALMLVSLLFKLAIDQRVTEIGTLEALGWPAQRVGRTLLLEGVFISVLGGALGVAIGVGYAWLMIWGLKTWWVGAITTPFLTLYVTPLSLIIGFVSGVIVCSLTIAWSLRQLKKLSTRELLGGQTTVQATQKKSSSLGKIIAGVLFLAALGLIGFATTLGGEAQAGAFVGGGAALLSALLLLLWNVLKAPISSSVQRLSLGTLAWGAARRNPSRSVLTVGLMASACFLIIAMNSFRLDPTASGAGGFDLVATTSEPVFADLNTAAGRKEALRNRAQDVEGATILELRYRSGDDASCNNLYQATQPRILGATPAFISHFDAKEIVKFEFAGSAAKSAEEKENPWKLLARDPVSKDEPIPVIIDKNTAMYSLHLYKGVGEIFPVKYEDGTELQFRVVGLLSNSILQGSLIVGELDFVKRFPEISGYRYFLVGAPAEKLPQVKAALSEELSDQGFDPQSTHELLADLLQVQNTYLSTFQSLGALGLLLGTFGLATVQLRSVLERRRELALLRAEGFARSRIARLVLIECLLLLAGGLATGTIAALLAVLPHMLFGGASLRLGGLALMLGIVFVAGVLASLVAVRATLKADIIAALRGE
jgi:ABC-type antimicrobial peptide transport system permease subunit